MKILHLNTYDVGGAANAAIRLHEGLLENGIKSKILFLKKSGRIIEESKYVQKNPDSFFKRKLKLTGFGLNEQEKLSRRAKKIKGDYEWISFPCSPIDVTESPYYKEADIINLHWVGDFLDWDSFFLKVDKPVVWTMHDMNPILGIFHYMADRDNNIDAFGSLEGEMTIKKSDSIKKCRQSITVVAPSKWLKAEIEKSEIFSMKRKLHIPYGVPHSIFRPFNRADQKKRLGSHLDKKLILFVSQSVTKRRKGADLLIKAMGLLKGSKYQLIAVGLSESNAHAQDILYTGQIDQEDYLRNIFAAADVFVIPSREDNLPNTVLESMACGTPVVGFNIGGIPDMVIDGETGFLAEAENAQDLSDKIKTILENDALREQMGLNARNKVLEQYALGIQAQSYLSVYRELVDI